ncbi:hypothetical protein HID58_065247 [Brassica napus]|uniref:Uncharacterized protein n=1 Tax=Brassica napus TaxID=3708 RepID=A0ABQ7ZCP2_BRANA|nr:hypothetical protein HID58_065247 [Brassica napus]
MIFCLIDERFLNTGSLSADDLRKPHKDGISSFPNSSIWHSVYQSSSSPPNPKPRSLLERRLRLIIISARPRKPLNFTLSCVSSDPNASDSIKRDECTSSHGCTARRNLGKERNMLKVETVSGRTLVWVSRLPVTPLKVVNETDELKAVGVDEVVLAINYQPEVMLNFLKDFEAKLEIKITCSQETERMVSQCSGCLGDAGEEERDDEDEEQPEMERRGGGRGISNGGCGGAEQEEEEERRRRRADRDARRRRMK